MTASRSRLVAASLVAAYTVASVVSVIVTRGGGNDLLEDLGLRVGLGMFTAIGALLIARRPDNPVGWLLGSVGVMVALGATGESLAVHVLSTGRTPGLVTRWLAWLNTWFWYAMLGIVVVAIPLLFPDGRLPSRRWRVPAGIVGGTLAALCAVGALADRVELQTEVAGTGLRYAVDNPIGIAGLAGVEEVAWAQPLFLSLPLGLLLGIAAVVVRFRRSRGTTERAQLKWYLFALSLLPLVFVVDVVGASDVVNGVLFIAAVIAMATAIAVAILRYRLYDIDRVISRTLSYTLVTGGSVGVYAGIVLGVGTLLPGQRSDLLVAAATLAAAAAFGPLRRQVQTAVDRRFDRSRFDARLVVEQFGARTRDEVDVAALADEIRSIVAVTVQPTTASLWLRGAP